MFNKEILQRLMKANREDPYNSYGDHVKMCGGIRYGLHPTPELVHEPDNLYTGPEMYEDIKPRMIGGRLSGGRGPLITDFEERGGSLKSVGKSLSRGLKKVGKAIAPIAKGVAKDVVMPVVKDFASKQGRKLLEQQLAKFAIKDVLPVAEEAAPLMLAAAGRKRKSGGRLSGGALVGSGRRESRAMLVKKIMKEHGCTLPVASKYIKENNLTY